MELSRIRQQGWALARNEMLQGIGSLSTTVANKHLGKLWRCACHFHHNQQNSLIRPLRWMRYKA